MNLYKEAKQEQEAPSKFKITMTLDGSQLSQYEKKILEDKAKHMVMPGFRKGEAPVDLVAKHLGEQNIREEAAKELAAQALAEYVLENQMKVVGSPNIVLGDVQTDADINLEAHVATLPEITVKDDYKSAIAKINAQPLEELSVTDEDVQNVINHLRREKARILTLEAMQQGKADAKQMPDFNSIPEDKLPQLDDKDFKELAGAENMEDFRVKVKENIKTEKEFAVKDKRRAEIAEELLKHVDVDLPEEIVQMELDRSKAQMEQDLQMMGLSLDAYLAQIQKNKDDFEKEMRDAARKRAILQLALDKIAETEGLRVDPAEIEKEVEHILSHTPQANKDDVRAFVDAQKSNEMVFDFLTNIK